MTRLIFDCTGDRFAFRIGVVANKCNLAYLLNMQGLTRQIEQAGGYREGRNMIVMRLELRQAAFACIESLVCSLYRL